MQRIKYYYLFIAVLVFSISCSMNKDPREIFKNAEKACSEIKTGIYHASYTFKPANEDTTYLFECTCMFKKINTKDEIGAKVAMSFPDRMIYVYDGTKSSFYLPKDRKIEIDTTASRFDFYRGSMKANLINIPLLNPKDFSNYLNAAEKVWYEGATMIDGAECYIVALKHRDKKEVNITKDVSYWYIGKNDGVPRKWEETYFMDGQKVSRVLMLSELNMNADITDGVFFIPKPRSFTVEYTSEQDNERQPLLENGAIAPEFSLKNAKGESVALSSFRNKIVVLDFWGSWCFWCGRAMPSLEALSQKYKDKGVVVVGLSCKEKKNEDAVNFMKKKNCNYTLLLEGDNVAKDYKVSGFPTLYIINKEGKIEFSQDGFSDDIEKKFSKVIDKMLK